MSTEQCLKLKRWQDLPNLNRVQYEIVMYFEVSLFIQFNLS